MISSNQFVQALEKQLASRPQLGALAIDTGKLTVKQVFEILRLQADEPHVRFGELAVRAQLLTQEELASLLFHQSVRVKPMAKILVEMGFASTSDIDEHFAEYRAASQPEAQKELSTAC
ncbi:MAG: hypothetical protein KDA57_10345 [Planctomycetales bacterium]|nr:hypothetical protein [Planctomycetales bacterium]